jgi:hypothetical protein
MSEQVLGATVADLPAPKAAPKAKQTGSISPQARLAILAGMVLVGVVYLVASVFPGRVPYLRSEGSADTSANAIAMHCERFIEIARAHYGRIGNTGSIRATPCVLTRCNRNGSDSGACQVRLAPSRRRRSSR